eukprot:Sdes_comp19191_c0_seq2m10025
MMMSLSSRCFLFGNKKIAQRLMKNPNPLISCSNFLQIESFHSFRSLSSLPSPHNNPSLPIGDKSAQNLPPSSSLEASGGQSRFAFLKTTFDKFFPPQDSTPLISEAKKALEKSDYHSAYYLFREAVEFDRSSEGLYSIGEMYLHGHGVPRDESIAFEWFSAAFMAGHKNSTRQVANCLIHGIGTEKDEKMGNLILQNIDTIDPKPESNNHIWSAVLTAGFLLASLAYYTR